MIRLLVEIINFIGCVIAGLLAWACFAAGSELYKAHGAKEVSS